MHIVRMCIYIYIYLALNLSLSLYIELENFCCPYFGMYVRTHVCMHACMHACMDVCMYACGKHCRAAPHIVAPQHPPWVRLTATVTKGTLCKVVMLSIGLEDTLAYYNAADFVAGFKKTLASQVCVIKQNEASQVAWLSIGMEDRLASCTIAAFAAGFLKSVALQMCVINQVEHGLVRQGHLDHETESWQLTHFPRCDGVHGLEGHAVQSVHFEHGCGGHSRILLGGGFCGWLSRCESSSKAMARQAMASGS